MALLSLRLLGVGTLELDGQLIRPHSAKALALLAFLVIESDRPHNRDKLAGLLWGGLPEASARQCLRQALYSLRTIGGERLRERLVAGNESVRFRADPDIGIDVHRFVACAGSTALRDWSEAAALYRAPLLDGRSFDDCEAYAQWLGSARERLHALALQNLDRLVVDTMSRGDRDASLRHALALRDLDPTSEAAARHLFRIHAARDDRQAIEAEWTRLCDLLGREFGVAPSQETAELRRALGQARRTETSPASLESSRIADPPRQQGCRRNPPDAEPFVRAARAAERVHAFSQAADLYDRALMALEHAAPASPERLFEILLLKEAALERLGLRAEQAGVVDRALAIAERLGDAARLASVLVRKAGSCVYLGERAEARRHAERALDLYRRTADQPGEAEALRELGFVHWHAEDYQAALRCTREALALHRRLGDVAGEASALHNLAEIHRNLGSPGRAMQSYEQALRLHWAARSHVGEILTLFGMANALQQAGDTAGAMHRYREALKLSETHAERTMQSRALHALALRHAEQQELDAALSLMRRAIEIDRAIGYAHGLGHDLVDLAHIHLERAERSEASAVLDEALVWFGFTGEHDALASTHALIRGLESEQWSTLPWVTSRFEVKSHLSLGEGKVYCAFESPLGASAMQPSGTDPMAATTRTAPPRPTPEAPPADRSGTAPRARPRREC